MDGQVTPPTWGPPPPCKQALNLYITDVAYMQRLLFLESVYLVYWVFWSIVIIPNWNRFPSFLIILGIHGSLQCLVTRAKIPLDKNKIF